MPGAASTQWYLHSDVAGLYEAGAEVAYPQLSDFRGHRPQLQKEKVSTIGSLPVRTAHDGGGISGLTPHRSPGMGKSTTRQPGVEADDVLRIGNRIAALLPPNDSAQRPTTPLLAVQNNT